MRDMLKLDGILMLYALAAGSSLAYVNGKTASDVIKVKKNGGDRDSITGATISSRTVADSIQRRLTELMKIVGGRS